MKKFLPVLIILMSFLLIASMTACGKDNEQQTATPSGGEQSTPSGEQQQPAHTVHTYGTGVVTTAATYNADGVKTFTCECGATKTETIPSLCPTSAQVVQGIQTVKDQSTKSYDFDIKLNGQVYSVNANAVYSGKYRYDRNTSQLRFERETSGNILFSTHEYIYSEGDSRVKVTTNKNNAVKKISVATAEDDEMNMLNLPFIKIVEALNADNLKNVAKDNSNAKYKFSASMQLTSGFSPVQKLLSYVGKIGSTVSIKNVSFTNPQGGVKIYFNMTDDGKLADFTYAIDVSFPVSGTPVALSVEYAQKASSTTITLPNISNYISDATGKTNALTTINSAINAVKNSDAYSLDLTAVNDLDAGWNKTAVVDKYFSRMYKNTNESRVDFNHSYEYKSHTEEDGKETFKYNVANIQDGSVYKISRKGGNTQTALPDISIDDEFNIHLTGMTFTASDLDFIFIVNNSDGSKTYKLYLKNSTGITVQKDICDLINSNEGEGVVPVENYFNESDYSFEECDCSFTIKNNMLVSATVETELHYTPIGGEYTNDVVTLKDSIELIVNDNLDKASEYSAPKNVETKLGSFGLNNSKYYIR